MDAHYSDELSNIPFIDADGESADEAEEVHDGKDEEEEVCNGGAESSMDIAPTLLNIFDAVVGQDTIRRKQILCKMGTKEDGFGHIVSILDDEKPEADKIVHQDVIGDTPNSKCGNCGNAVEDSSFTQNSENETVSVKLPAVCCDIQTSPLSQTFDKRTSWTESMSDASDSYAEIDDTPERSEINENKYNRTNSDIDYCSNNNSSSAKSGRTRRGSRKLAHEAKPKLSAKARPASAEILLDDDDDISSQSVTNENEVTPTDNRVRKSSRINPPIPFSLNIQNSAMSPCGSPQPSPPGSPKLSRSSPTRSPHLTYMDRKVQEVLETECNYVNDLGIIIQGYMNKMRSDSHKHLSQEKFQTLFCNLEEIHEFNKDFLEDLEQCNNNPVYVAECFLEREDEFHIYTKYCTNYPSAVEILTECAYNDTISEYLRTIQASLDHGLPLGAYLLKPVQRILKYHLLFQDMYKHFNKDDKGYDTIGDALECMTDVAKYINEMKRKHEAAVRKQEIQSQLHGWQENLTSYGELVLEDVFKMQGARAERNLYLFEKALFICKKEDALLSIKALIQSSNLMLIESIPKAPFCFNVVPFDQPHIQYTIAAKSMEQKKIWTHELKRLILENYQSNIPDKVKELILKATTPESDNDKVAPSHQENNLSRTRKDRKSGRRNKRRNSEPLGRQLQRGQKQVKAAVENFLTGMKRPDLSKLGMRPVSEIQRIGEAPGTPDESLDEMEKSQENLMEESENKDLLSQPLDESLEEEEEIEHEDTPSSPTEETLAPRSLGSFSRPKESNRDSGIGSMTLTESAKTDADEKSEKESSSSVDPAVDKESHTRDDIEEIIEGMESPDELEVLENLSEEIEGPSDHEEEDAKLLREREFQFRQNIRDYNRNLKSGEEVWEKMQNDSRHRGRSSSHGMRHGMLYNISLPNTPIRKSKLSRAVSEDSRLASVANWAPKSHSYSDPNITKLENIHNEEFFEDESSQITLDSSNSSLGFEKTSHHSSKEDLLKSMDNEFKRLERKYSVMEYRDCSSGSSPVRSRTNSNSEAENKEESVSSEGTKCLPSEKQDSTASKEAKVKVMEVTMTKTSHRVFSLARKYSVLTKEEQKPIKPTSKFTRDKKAPTEINKKSLTGFKEKSSVHKVALHKSVIKERKDSTSSLSDSQDGKSRGKRPSKSDPFAERDGTKSVIAVSENEDGRKTVLTNQEGRDRLGSNSNWREKLQSMGSFDPEVELQVHRAKPVVFEESEGEDDGIFIKRDARSRSVKDVVKKMEVKSTSECKQSKGATPVQAPSIRQRLQTLQDKQRNRPTTRGDPPRLKSLQERKRELEECFQKPKNAGDKSLRNSDSISISSECSDSGMFVSGLDDRSMTSSRGSSRRSSFGSNTMLSLRFGPPLVRDLLDSTDWDNPQPTSAAEEELLIPLKLKSLRQRLEELQRAASKPVPRMKPNPRAEIQASAAQTTDLKSLVELDVDPVKLRQGRERITSEVPGGGVYYGKKSSAKLEKSLSVGSESSRGVSTSPSHLRKSSPVHFGRTSPFSLGRNSPSSLGRVSPANFGQVSPAKSSTSVASSSSSSSYLDSRSEIIHQREESTSSVSSSDYLTPGEL